MAFDCKAAQLKPLSKCMEQGSFSVVLERTNKVLGLLPDAVREAMYDAECSVIGNETHARLPLLIG